MSESDQSDAESLAHTHRDEKNDDGPRGGSATPMEGRCAAKLRKSDPSKFCCRYPLAGKTRCRLHGGKSLVGMASPTYKGRGYTKDLPARLLERLVEGIDDPNLTSLRTEIALLDARLGEIGKTMSEAGPAESWASVRESAVRLRRVADRPDMDARETALEGICVTLEEAVKNNQTEEAAWKEVYSIIDRRRRTANVEIKREELESLTLRAAQATAFIAQVLAAIHEEVPDEAIKARIAARLSITLNRPPQ